MAKREEIIQGVRQYIQNTALMGQGAYACWEDNLSELEECECDEHAIEIAPDFFVTEGSVRNLVGI